MIVDHIGIVVRSLDDGIRQWEEMFGYKRNSDIALNTRQKVRVVFLSKRGSITIKLLEPSEDSSPVAMFARRGGGLHHLCFKCDDLKVQIPVLERQDAKFLVPPQPGEAFNGKDIAFFLARNNLNVELIDTPEKKGWKNEE